MNRTELFIVAIVLIVAIIFAVKSRQFDRFINWLTKPNKKR